MSELSEDVAARDSEGVCLICEAGPNEAHNQRDHDNWFAADDATWG